MRKRSHTLSIHKSSSTGRSAMPSVDNDDSVIDMECDEDFAHDF